MDLGIGGTLPGMCRFPSDDGSKHSDDSAAMRLTGTGAGSTARFFVMPELRPREPRSGQASSPPIGHQCRPRRTLCPPGAAYFWRFERHAKVATIGFHAATRYFEIEVRQPRAVGTRAGHQYVIQRRCQLVKEPLEDWEARASKAALPCASTSPAAS